MSWPETPCDHCPIGPDCKARRLKVGRYCELVDPSHPDYQPGYVARLGTPAIPPTPAQPPPPGFIQMAWSAAEAIARHVAAGMPTTAPDIREERLRICRECPVYRAESGRCGACGCLLEIKAVMARERCPLTPPKWGPVEPTCSRPSAPVVPGRTVD
jgi:hypothetical protein